MADRNSSSKLLFALAAALGVSLLVIAFLVGRESARSSAPDASPLGHILPPVPQVETEREAPSQASDARDPWQERDEDYRYADTHWDELRGIDQRPDASMALSNTRTDDTAKRDPVDPPSATKEPAQRDERAAVAEYFQQVDLIQSHAGAGDPNAFAMDMIKAGMGGATSGFDQLIADSDRMKRELESMTPPPSCAQYHQANLEMLEESRGMLESMKVAITTRNMESLSALAQQSADLQARAEALSAFQEKLRAAAR
ncbi:MAG: hypothetical protein JRG93_14805 [Deltaproteobacteria bacterium]|nr:hypothetical protein [Deltaproteobacteria bacterium]